MARCIEARSVRSPTTTSAPNRRRASARSSSRRTMARTLCPFERRNSVRLRPMPPTAPAAPVTRIGLSCLWFVVMSLTLAAPLSAKNGHFQFASCLLTTHCASYGGHKLINGSQSARHPSCRKCGMICRTIPATNSNQPMRDSHRFFLTALSI